MTTSYVEFIKNRNHLNARGKGRHTASSGKSPDLLPYPIDTNVNSLLIDDKIITDQLADAITDGEILETMNYAPSTLTLDIEDRERTMIHGLLAQWVSAAKPLLETTIRGQRRHIVLPTEWNEIYCTLDGRDFALVQVHKTGDQFQLAFEHRGIHEMRRYNSPRVWYRDQFTRAMTIQSMCEEVHGYHVDFFAPELHVIQPIAVTRGLPTPKEVAVTKSKGFAKGAKLTIKGHQASPQQRDNLATVLKVGDSMKAPYGCLVAALISVIELSNAQSGGVFEFGGGNGLFGFITSTDDAHDAHAFFSNAIQQYTSIPGITPDDLAWVVESGQRSGHDAPFTPAEFARWIPEAEAALNEWGTSKHGGSISFSEYNRFAFTRGQNGKREDSFSCSVRLAKEVNWYLFAVDNTIYYVSSNDLRYSIPYDTISEDSEGIDTIDYELDTGKPINEITITAHFDRWQAPPGVPIVIEDSGPANGRWLVWEVRRPLFSNVGEITCHLPSPPLPEPAATTKTVRIKATATTLSGNAKVDAVYAKAIEISSKNLPYVYGGGGYPPTYAPTGPMGATSNSPGYDCTGYVTACLAAGGLIHEHMDSSALAANWGDPGEGKLMTVWATPQSGPTGHGFIEFKIPGAKYRRADTVPDPGGADGPHVRTQWPPPESNFPSGFTPRHFPGT